MYRYETHCHANACSRCAHSTPEEMARAYKAAGFAGMVLTDHFIHGYTCVPHDLPWEERMRRYYDAYLRAKGAVEDFDVIFGLEHAYGGGQEVLCYGIDLDFLLQNPDIPELSLKEFADRVHAYGGILIQAHPYRYGGWDLHIPTDIVDGIEVYNAGNRPEQNAMAMEKAAEKAQILLSGGDIHIASNPNLGTAGIILPYRVHTARELIAALRKGDHELII